MSVTAPYEDVLVPTDGSEAVEKAVEHAISLARFGDAQLHVVYVIDSRITMAADADTRPQLEASMEADGTAAMNEIADLASTADIPVTSTLRRGTPWKAILEYVDDAGIDLVVMGKAGKTPREKLMNMGSTSERVVDDATVPVLVVPA